QTIPLYVPVLSFCPFPCQKVKFPSRSSSSFFLKLKKYLELMTACGTEILVGGHGVIVEKVVMEDESRGY
ncbi:MAG: hypothetical protein ACO39X_05290, partial [Candidatus Nanopelagicaceae bacterium]